MKKYLKKILTILSRAIYLIIPEEYKPAKKKSLLQNKLDEELTEETFNHFKEEFKKSLLFDDIWKIRKYAIEEAKSIEKTDNENYTYLEFGVHVGKTTRFFSNYVDKIFGFDGFKGLKDDWLGSDHSKRDFILNKIPKFNSNVELIIGWVEDTLNIFLEKKKPKIIFVHMDLDTYKSTKFVLENIKPYIVKNSIIVFDNFFNYYGWKNGEFKSLEEVFNRNEYDYKAFCITSGIVIVQMK